ncbi:hypothetical protein M378DRAFT_179712 [Amanita muscaria Koide BX008]|uniref:Uncharacterized protein n=1 Tax=Amanita muscaria (strain Koide BX008) TaxID=946122 RepID=A0A0C2WZU5_AMAMK|nr:hypothetical protein M378DRAFT_179712 [Amanita muscaria Koide BX008]
MFAPSSPDRCCNELAPATQSSHDGLCVARQPFLSAAAQNISRCCPLTSHPDMLLSQEYPAHRTFANDIFSSPTTFFHPLPNCCQITHEAHQSSVGLRQHGTTERRVVEETPSLLFQASSNSSLCVPSASMGIVHGRDGDRFVAADRRMSTTENYVFPNAHRTVPEHVGNVTDHAMSDARRLRMFDPSALGRFDMSILDTDSVIFDQAHNRASFMQRSPNLIPPTHRSVPVPAFSNAHNVERELVQPGGGETSKSTETNVERPSMYSLSGSGMWRCNGCVYETKRERDIGAEGLYVLRAEGSTQEETLLCDIQERRAVRCDEASNNQLLFYERLTHCYSAPLASSLLGCPRFIPFVTLTAYSKIFQCSNMSPGLRLDPVNFFTSQFVHVHVTATLYV